MTTDTTLRPADRYRMLNLIASYGGEKDIPYGEVTVSGETVSGKRLSLAVRSVSIVHGAGATVLLERGYSCPWADLSDQEKDALRSFLLREAAPALADDAERLAERYTLRRLNLGFIRRHGDLREEDFAKMDEVRRLVGKARTFTGGAPQPVPGDTVHGTYYNGKQPFQEGMLDTPYPWHREEGTLLLCAHPYSPFTHPSGSTPEGYSLSTSGGPFFTVRKEHLEYEGETERLFTVWGHAGPCADGALRFPAKVSRWRLSPESGI